MCIFVYVCMYVCVCMSVPHTYLCVHVCGGQRLESGVSFIILYLIYWGNIYHLNPALTNWSCIASRLVLGILYLLLLQNTGVTGRPQAYLAFTWALIIWTPELMILRQASPSHTHTPCELINLRKKKVAHRIPQA